MHGLCERQVDFHAGLAEKCKGRRDEPDERLARAFTKTSVTHGCVDKRGRADWYQQRQDCGNRPHTLARRTGQFARSSFGLRRSATGSVWAVHTRRARHEEFALGDNSTVSGPSSGERWSERAVDLLRSEVR